MDGADREPDSDDARDERRADARRRAIEAVVGSPLFPFESDWSLRPLGPLADAEPPRDGEDGRPCPSCTDHGRVLWSNDRWKLTSIRPSANPVGLFLETVDHVDFEDLDSVMASEFGQLCWHLERAISAIESVGRVHIHRWGDGSSHFHVWFQGRPARRPELVGWGNVLWSQLLPPLPADEVDENHRRVVADLVTAVGGWPN